MSGVLNGAAGFAAGGNDLSYSGNVVVGQVQIGGGKGGPVTTQRGYADATRSISGSSFGSRSPTTTSGFTIVGLYFETITTGAFAQTTLVVSGDSSAKGATMAVNGNNQSLGAGVYSSGPNTTTYQSPGIIADPFGTTGGTATVTIN